MTDRELLEREEEARLRPEAARSALAGGRAIAESPCPWRTAFQRDRDRILHTKAFRRLEHKTQVFVAPEGDHYRTRLTHTLEVSQVARTICRVLRLNEDLAEAIALGHDLGHPPFGHAGESALDALLPGGFRHNEQSLRVVDFLERTERPYVGLNLCQEVREGIHHHTGAVAPETWEGQVARLADRIAYLNHDIDDAVRGGLLAQDELPSSVLKALGPTYSSRLSSWVGDVIEASRQDGRICQSEALAEVTESLRDFLFARVYVGSAAKVEESKVFQLLRGLYEYFLAHPEEIPPTGEEDPRRRAADYIAGMTDRFAVAEFSRLHIPSFWTG